MATKDLRKLSFSSAAERWFELTRSQVDSGDEGAALEALDRRLLCHKPTSDLEVLVVMEVVAENIRAGGRTDGLDLAALLNIRDRLLRESVEIGLGAALAGLQSLYDQVVEPPRLSA